MQEPGENGSGRGYRGVITDWGGVMTNPIPATVRAWLDADDIDEQSYEAVIRPWVISAYEPGTPSYHAASDGNPIHALERGECSTEEFERLLASLLVRRNGSPVAPDGLLTRMFGASVPCEPMYGALYTVRAAGLRTGLLSNSWGVSDYPRHLFGDLFDAVVISAEVGMRKPEERIFLHAAGLLGLPPADCVFVDDIEANVTAAEAVGMTAILHSEPEATIIRLHELLGLPGSPARD